MAEEFPQELENACKNFEGSMLQVEKSLSPLLDTERSQLLRGLSSLDAAKLDLLAIYSMNSFYWAYLIMQGVDPKTHPIKQELGRIQTYMAKVEEIQNRKNAPKLAKDTAKRFVRNALFDSNQKKAQTASDSDDDTFVSKESAENDSEVKTDIKKKTKKRKAEKEKKSKKRSKK